MNSTSSEEEIMVMPTDVRVLVPARQELERLMEKARKTGRPISNNELNRVSRSSGMDYKEIYEVMYKITKEFCPADSRSVMMWVNGKRSDV